MTDAHYAKLFDTVLLPDGKGGTTKFDRNTQVWISFDLVLLVENAS